MSSFDNFMCGFTFGLLSNLPFLGGWGFGGFNMGCGCGYGGVGGFIFGGGYNAVNLTGFANPFPPIFGGGYMMNANASASGLIMPQGFANNSFPQIDFSSPCQTIWDTFTNPNSDYNKGMMDWFQKSNTQTNPFQITNDKPDEKEPDKQTAKVEVDKTNKQEKQYRVKQQKQTKSANSSSAGVSSKLWTQMTDAEMKQVYGNYSESITDKYDGTAEDLNKALKGNGILEGKGQAFIDAQNKYGISASVLAAIAINESGHGKSRLAKKQNNVGGVRKSGSTQFRKFNSVEDCIMEMARFLKVGYVDKGLTKLYQVNAKYCPAADTTDTTNTNAQWAGIVSSNLQKIESIA